MKPSKYIVLIGKMPPPYYGTAVWYELLLSSSITLRYNIAFYDSRVHGSLSTLSRPGFYSVVTNVRNIIMYTAFLIRHRGDVVHMPISQSPVGILRDSLYIWISVIFRRRVILQLHGSKLDTVVEEAGYILRKISTATFMRVYGAVVLSERFRYIFQNLGIEKVWSVPNGADYPEYEPQYCERKSVLYLSNLQRSKGLEDVLKAMSIVQGHLPEVVLDVVGGWRSERDRSEYQQIVDSMGINVQFHGPMYNSDKYEYYKRATVFVFVPREPEGHPWVINEALYHKCPIIATDVGMISDAVLDGVNGYLVSKNSPDEIAQRLIEILNDDDLCRNMGEESRRVYENNYTLNHMIEPLAKVFDEILA